MGIKRFKKYSLYMSLVLLVILLYMFESNLALANKEIVSGLSESLIRFHVLANSNSEADQKLKLKVKDAVVEEMSELLKDSLSKEQSKKIMLAHQEDILRLAKDIVRDEGYDYEVTIALENEEFPVKKYGDIVLPKGNYEALIIRIGEAKGRNWWCVLFPPLCFVDATHDVVDDETKDTLKNLLTDEEYNAILLNNSENVKIRVRFKLLDWLEDKEKDLTNNRAVVYDN